MAIKPKIFGHRGAMGEAPENTLISFQKALEDGAHYLEFDVRKSKDGTPVIIHDATVNRTTNGRGEVTGLKVAELKRIDAGYWHSTDGGKNYPFRGKGFRIPTLQEFLEAYPETKAIVEVKQRDPPMVQEVLDLLGKLGRENQVLLATEEDAIMKDVRRELAGRHLSIATGFSYGEVAEFIRWANSGRKPPFVPAGQALQIPCQYAGLPLVTPETLKAAHELELEMFVWTINDPDEMRRLLDMGVDGVITDYPARLRALMR